MQKLIKIALIAPIASLLILAMSAVPVSAAKIRTFIAVLNGGQEVPPTGSGALGNALVTFDKETKMLCYAIAFTPLDTDEIAAHFHAPAPPEANASIVFTISGGGPPPPGPSPLGSPKTGCVGPLSKTQENDLKRGLFYINIHSVGVPSGEIRGQVLRTK